MKYVMLVGCLALAATAAVAQPADSKRDPQKPFIWDGANSIRGEAPKSNAPAVLQGQSITPQDPYGAGKPLPRAEPKPERAGPGIG